MTSTALLKKRDRRANPDQRAAVVDALGELEPDPFTGDIEESQVKIVIGEIGDIWPENIREPLHAAA